MRDLKFRAWNKEEKRFEYFDISDFFDTLFYTSGYSFASLEFQQYTGLKDKNGVEIYEGDVVQSGTLRGVIEFNHGTFGLRTSLSTWYGVGTLEDCEVIGNIYENPDLKPD